MSSDWGSEKSARLPRRPSKLPQTHFQRSLTTKVEAFSGRDPERSRRGEPAAEILSEANGSHKSLFRNTLPVSPLNPKTWRDFPPNSMILKDRGGYPLLLNSNRRKNSGRSLAARGLRNLPPRIGAASKLPTAGGDLRQPPASVAILDRRSQSST
jgi:hypothetical protein